MSSLKYIGPNGVVCTLRREVFINNEFVPAESGKEFATVNPSTELEIAKVAEGDAVDIDKAVKAARAAFPSWSKTTGAERGKLLLKVAELLEEEAMMTELTTIEVLDVGKTYAEAKDVDLPVCAQHFRYFAGWADKISGDTFDVPDQLIYTRKEPIGVVGAIIPWNFPMVMLTYKLGAALAAGCTVVVKPAEQTPLSALRFCDVLMKAGFPKGVVNVVPGFGPTAGAALASHMDVDKLSFTGSTQTGRLILEMAAKSNLKRVTLELGGKSPVVIMDDADIDFAAKVAHNAIYFNAGQVCVAGSRVFVQEGIYDKFCAKAKELAEERAKNLGDPFDETSSQGPQVSQKQVDTILKYIDLGKAEGATLLTGGARKSCAGYFVEPTIFTDVKAGMKIHDEEIFGPVVGVMKFTDLDDAALKANASTYGLAAAVVTKDITKALNAAHALKAGTVWVNQFGVIFPGVPFGGFKQSGIGRENAKLALDHFTETKSVLINLKPPE